MPDNKWDKYITTEEKGDNKWSEFIVEEPQTQDGLPVVDESQLDIKEKPETGWGGIPIIKERREAARKEKAETENKLQTEVYPELDKISQYADEAIRDPHTQWLQNRKPMYYDQKAADKQAKINAALTKKLNPQADINPEEATAENFFNKEEGTPRNEMQEATLRLVDKSHELKDIYEKVKDQGDLKNLGSGIVKGATDYFKDYATIIDQLKDNKSIKGLNEKLQAINNGKDLDLTDDEIALLKALQVNTQLAENVSKVMPGSYEIGEMTGKSLGFMGEFILTAGVGSGVAKSIKAAGKGAKAAGRISANLAAKLAQSGIQVGAMPGFYKEAAKGIALTGKPGASLWDAYYDQFTETFSERIFMGAVGSAQSKNAVMNFLQRTGNAVANARGWKGVVKGMGEEILEEKFGELMQGAKQFDSFDKFWKSYLDVDQNLKMMASTSLITGVLGTANAAAYQKKKNEVHKNLLELSEKVPESIKGEIDNLINEKVSYENLFKTAKDLVKQEYDNGNLNDEQAKEVGVNTLRYVTTKVHENQLMDVEQTDEFIKKQKAKELIDERLKVDKNWETGPIQKQARKKTGQVRIGQVEDGSVVEISGINENGEIISYTPDGVLHKLKPEQITEATALSNEEFDSFLNTFNERQEQAREFERIQKEKQAKVDVENYLQDVVHANGKDVVKVLTNNDQVYYIKEGDIDNIDNLQIGDNLIGENEITKEKEFISPKDIKTIDRSDVNSLRQEMMFEVLGKIDEEAEAREFAEKEQYLPGQEVTYEGKPAVVTEVENPTEGEGIKIRYINEQGVEQEEFLRPEQIEKINQPVQEDVQEEAEETPVLNIQGQELPVKETEQGYEVDQKFEESNDANKLAKALNSKYGNLNFEVVESIDPNDPFATYEYSIVGNLKNREQEVTQEENNVSEAENIQSGIKMQETGENIPGEVQSDQPRVESETKPSEQAVSDLTQETPVGETQQPETNQELQEEKEGVSTGKNTTNENQISGSKQDLVPKVSKEETNQKLRDLRKSILNDVKQRDDLSPNEKRKLAANIFYKKALEIDKDFKSTDEKEYTVSEFLTPGQSAKENIDEAVGETVANLKEERRELKDRGFNSGAYYMTDEQVKSALKPKSEKQFAIDVVKALMEDDAKVELANFKVVNDPVTAQKLLDNILDYENGVRDLTDVNKKILNYFEEAYKSRKLAKENAEIDFLEEEVNLYRIDKLYPELDELISDEISELVGDLKTTDDVRRLLDTDEIQKLVNYADQRVNQRAENQKRQETDEETDSGRISQEEEGESERTAEEIAIEYRDEALNAPINKLTEWEKDLLTTRVNKRSFLRYNDKNNITSTLARAWFNTKDKANSNYDIDIIASDLSEQYGIDITPQEISDFIVDNPGKYVRKTTDKQQELAKEYKELTGESIKKHDYSVKTKDGRFEVKEETEAGTTEEEVREFLDKVEPFNFGDEKKVLEENKEKVPKGKLSEYRKIAAQLESEADEPLPFKIKEQLEQEIADKEKQLKEVIKAKNKKIVEFNDRRGLFGDTKFAGGLFGDNADFSEKNLDKIIEPENNQIARLKQEIKTLKANKDQKANEADSQGVLFKKKKVETPEVTDATEYQVKVGNDWYNRDILKDGKYLQKGDIVPELLKTDILKVGDDLFINPRYISDENWEKINTQLERQGFEKRKTSEWKNYFINKNKGHLIVDEHKKAFEIIFKDKLNIKEVDNTPKNNELIKKAKEYFGVTTDFNEAGYLLTDGKMLDLSGKNQGGPSGTRALDHREVNVLDTDMIEFMSFGNIRMKPESDGFEVTQKPTKEQIPVLKRFVRESNNGVLIDYGIEGDYGTIFSIEYGENAKPERVINDIINYYNNGVKPVLSNSVRFKKKPFYSNTEKAIESIKQEKATPEQWKSMLLKNGSKEAELDWLGWDEFVQGKKSITKRELQDFVNANKVEIQEVVNEDIEGKRTPIYRGSKYALPETINYLESNPEISRDDFILHLENDYDVYKAYENNFPDLIEDDNWAEIVVDEVGGYKKEDRNNTKYSQYVTPGGENYRELLLTMPNKSKPKLNVTEESWEYGNIKGKIKKIPGDIYQVYREGKEFFKAKNLSEVKNGLKEKISDYDGLSSEAKGEFKSSHFEEPNIVAHVRFNERTDSEGNRVLFIEEIQSDWAQEGRKKGFKILKPKYSIEEVNGKYKAKNNDTNEYFKNPKGGDLSAPTKQILLNIVGEQNFELTGIPNMPFKQTNQWVGLAFKRMIQYAAENGFDKIAWTTGEQQAERYDLSKQVDKIYAYRKTNGNYDIEALQEGVTALQQNDVSRNKLSEIVGKELAEKIVNNEGKNENPLEYEQAQSFSGQDLKVGGEGMKAFYDKILPNYANKFGKKFGAKVENTKIDVNPELTDEGIDLQSGEVKQDTKGKYKTVQSIPITEKLADTAIEQGFPMFKNIQKPKKPQYVGEYVEYQNRKKAFEDAVKEATSNIEKELGIKVNVLKSFNNIPKNIKARLSKTDGTGIIGMYDPVSDQVFLFLDNIDDVNEAVRTVLHEVVGHKGLRSLLGEDYKNVLRDVFKSMKQEDIDRISKLYGTNNRLIIADEYLAEMAEQNKKPTFIQRAISEIRAILRRLFGIKFSDNDIHVLLQKSRENLKKQVKISKFGTNENIQDTQKEKDSKEFPRRKQTNKSPQRSVRSRGEQRQPKLYRETKEKVLQLTKDLQTKEFDEELFNSHFDKIRRLQPLGDNVAQLAYELYNRMPEKGVQFKKLKRKSLTDTKAFKDWFGDSKVVDENGEPLVVYHGTDANFNVFDKDKGSKWASKVGFWFTDNSDFAEMFGDNIMPVYVSIKNPLTISKEKFDDMRTDHAKDKEWWDVQKDKWLKNGYDGLKISSSKENFAGIEVNNPAIYAAFEPTQIKSVNNKGAFDPNNSDIRFKKKDISESTKETVIENSKEWRKWRNLLNEIYNSEDGSYRIQYDNDGDWTDNENEFNEYPLDDKQYVIDKNKEGYEQYKQALQDLADELGAELNIPYGDSFYIEKGDKTISFRNHDVKPSTRAHHHEIYPILHNDGVSSFELDNAIEWINKQDDIRFKKKESEGEKFAGSIFDEKAALDKKEQKLREKIKTTPKLKETHYSHTLIKNKIRDLKQGWKLGKQDTKKNLVAIQKAIINYAKKNMPFDQAGKADVNKLLSLINKADNPTKLEDAYNKINEIVYGLNKGDYINKIDKLLKGNKPKKVNGKPKGTLDPDVYAALDKIRAIRKMTPDEFEKYYENIEEHDVETVVYATMFGNLEDKSPEQLADSYKKLIDIVDEGKVWFKEEMEAEKKRLKNLRYEVIGKITGGKGILPAQEYPGGVPIKKGNVDQFLNQNQSFEWILDKLSKDKTEETAQGMMQEYFGDLVHKSTNAEVKGINNMTELIHDKAAEIFGKDKKRLARVFAKNSVKDKNSGVTFRSKTGKRKELALSQNEAYKKWMEWQDPTLEATFKEMGWDETTKAELDEFMTPEVKKWAKWQLEEFYPMYYEGVNERFREAYFVNLPFNEKYSPIRREVTAVADKDDALLKGSSMLASVGSGSLKSRVANINHLQMLDGDQVLSSHISEMEHFKAWVHTMKELRSVFGSRGVQHVIKFEHGNGIRKILNQQINDFASAGRDRADVIDTIDKIRRAFVTAELGLNYTIFPKQLVSVLTYMSEMPVHNYLGGMMNLALNFRTAINTITESTTVKDRYKKGWTHEVRSALKSDNTKKLSGARSTLNDLRNLLMIPAKLGDFGGVLGGWSVYHYHYKKQKDLGKTDSEAHQYALNKFERAMSRSQQSARLADTSELQKGSWGKLFTMFKNSQQQYFRYESAAIRNLIKGRGSKLNNIKIIALYHVLLPVAFQAIANAFTDDDDEKEKKRLLRAGILGSFNGILIASDIIEYVLEKAMGEKWSYSATPLEGAVNNIGYGTYNISTGLKDMDREKIMKGVEQLGYGINNMSIGLPYRPTKKLIQKVKDAKEPERVRAEEAEDEFKKLKKKNMDWRSQAKKLKEKGDEEGMYNMLNNDKYIDRQYTIKYINQDLKYIERDYEEGKISDKEYYRKKAAVIDKHMKKLQR